jgi:hypothetical protein
VTRARWARNRGWAGASGRGRARDPLEVGIGRDLEVGDREVGGVVCRALAGSVRAGDPPREAVVSGGSLHMALNSCRDYPQCACAVLFSAAPTKTAGGVFGLGLKRVTGSFGPGCWMLPPPL